MINMGAKDVVIYDDGWTVASADGLPTAHYENTVIITADGPEMTTFEEDI
jgi:methionyl aminopeptidase